MTAPLNEVAHEMEVSSTKGFHPDGGWLTVGSYRNNGPGVDSHTLRQIAGGQASKLNEIEIVSKDPENLLTNRLTTYERMEYFGIVDNKLVGLSRIGMFEEQPKYHPIFDKVVGDEFYEEPEEEKEEIIEPTFSDYMKRKK